MAMGQIVLLLYGLLMLAGGVMGGRAGSRVSLIAGIASGALLMAAFGVSLANLSGGLAAGTVIAVLLSVVFWRRVATTGKWMPSGALLIVSVAAGALLAYSTWQAL